MLTDITSSTENLEKRLRLIIGAKEDVSQKTETYVAKLGKQRKKSTKHLIKR